MSSQSFKFIVLNTLKHSDSGIVVQGYSDCGGRESFYLKCNGKNRAVKLSLLHPLNIIEINLSSRSFGSLRTIKDYSPVYILKSIRGDVRKSAIALFMGELVLRTIKEIEPNPPMFRFLENAIVTLEQLSEGVSNYHLSFILFFCGQLGYSPDLSGHNNGRYFDIPAARFTDNCSNPSLVLGEQESTLLRKLGSAGLFAATQIKADRNLRFNYLSGMIKYLTFHTGHEISVESLGVLHEVFE